jgi:hypothetical protein
MKIKELTPAAAMCVVGACPAIFESEDGLEILLIGKKRSIDALAHRVGADEEIVAIDKRLLLSALANLHNRR